MSRVCQSDKAQGRLRTNNWWCSWPPLTVEGASPLQQNHRTTCARSRSDPQPVRRRCPYLPTPLDVHMQHFEVQHFRKLTKPWEPPVIALSWKSGDVRLSMGRPLYNPRISYRHTLFLGLSSKQAWQERSASWGQVGEIVQTTMLAEVMRQLALGYIDSTLLRGLRRGEMTLSTNCRRGLSHRPAKWLKITGISRRLAGSPTSPRPA